MAAGRRDDAVLRATASWDADGDLRPALAERVPGREDSTLGADGRSVTWNLKKGVTRTQAALTADDVVFTREYACNLFQQQFLQGHRGLEGRSIHGRRKVPCADAVLGRRLRFGARLHHSQASVRRLRATHRLVPSSTTRAISTARRDGAPSIRPAARPTVLTIILFFVLTFLVSLVTFGGGRTNVLPGFVHLVLFAIFVFLIFVP